MTNRNTSKAMSGQRTALFLAGVGVFWIVATWAGSSLGLSMRLRALFDLIALAGFGWALWMTYGIWRSSQKDKG
jgi:threonine/homoserine/homoserine lactone efflux protein